MSLMGTLGKVAMGVIVAKGVGKVMGGNSGSSTGGLGGMLGGLMGGQQGGSTGGLGGLLGSLTGGSTSQTGGSAGGLGGLLGGLMGGQQGGSSAGGLGGLLSGLAGQGQQGGATGGLGGLLGQLGGATAATSGSTPDFGSMFNDALQGNAPEQVSDADERNAAVLLRAMISAAKSDGQLDADEKAKITEHLSEDGVTEEEAEFVRNELAAPLDLQGLIADVPSGLEQQVYLMSLMSITLDTKEEAVYLDALRQGLNISEQASNEIHTQLGAPTLYS
ncbi:DUF533 domain-containing protein [Leucothrix arctica]|uniref:DUF533 domain-containing protein n=1 Tax=Leucothrix arctica TaxID=1481894 RepID=A0A317C8F6_9GAMM|nr:DUF533 domain-containing protein [Leucothrix arctica]PWQ94864.1 DUF533 domain-containing protein [Leucothrix arctica]